MSSVWRHGRGAFSLRRDVLLLLQGILQESRQHLQGITILSLLCIMWPIKSHLRRICLNNLQIECWPLFLISRPRIALPCYLSGHNLSGPNLILVPASPSRLGLAWLCNLLGFWLRVQSEKSQGLTNNLQRYSIWYLTSKGGCVTKMLHIRVFADVWQNVWLCLVAGDQVHVQVGDWPVWRESGQQEILPGLQIQEVHSSRDEAGARPLGWSVQ